MHSAPRHCSNSYSEREKDRMFWLEECSVADERPKGTSGVWMEISFGIELIGD